MMISKTQVQRLCSHGLLPACVDCDRLPGAADSSGDLLELFLDAWKLAEGQASQRGVRHKAVHVIVWLEAARQSKSRLTLGIPTELNTCETLLAEFGERLIWWPRGIPAGEYLGIVSSRIGRKLDQQDDWFSALRSVCAAANPHRSVLVTAAKTTTAPYLQRCSQLFRLPLLQFHLPTAHQTCGRWFAGLMRGAPSHDSTAALQSPALVSPDLLAAESSEAGDAPPLRDRLTVAVSQQLVVLKMRPRGHIEQLVRQRFDQQTDSATALLTLAVGNGLVPSAMVAGFPAARTLAVEQMSIRIPSGQSHIVQTAGISVVKPHFAAVRSVDRRYATHCTRRADGPWPDQGLAEYHDSLILGHEERDHSALAALTRIVTQQWLWGSCRAIRGKSRVVCFTEVPVTDLGSLNTFRPHRGRWDFEPYGICIEHDWLRERGLRRVHYGDSGLWDRLPDSERPLFQQRYAGADGQIDWAVEREWRIIGDLDLSGLPADAAWLFVPTAGEATQLTAVSRWPVVALS